MGLERGSCEHRTVRQPASQTVRQSDSQTVRQSDSQTVRQSDSQTVRQSDSQTVRQLDSQTAPCHDRVNLTTLKIQGHRTCSHGKRAITTRSEKTR